MPPDEAPAEDSEPSDEETQSGADAVTTTEHSANATHLPVEKQLAYAIVNAFLNQITLRSGVTEELLLEALQREETFRHDS